MKGRTLGLATKRQRSTSGQKRPFAGIPGHIRFVAEADIGPSAQINEEAANRSHNEFADCETD